MKTKIKKLKFVSVIIVNYNNSKYIDRCIKSVLSQNYKNFEIIFVDNKSSDDSLKKLTKFKSQITIIKNKKRYSQGAYSQIKSYYKGILKSKGQIILFIDSDDFFKKNKIKEIVKYINKYDKKIVFDMPIIFYNKNNYSKFKYSFRETNFTPWPRFTCQSCISAKKNYLLKIYKKIEIKKYPTIWFDFRLAAQSFNDFEEVSLIKKYLTYYQQSSTSESNKYKKFSKNWWFRRKEAHMFVKYLYKKKSKKLNFDESLTNLINFFIR